MVKPLCEERNTCLKLSCTVRGEGTKGPLVSHLIHSLSLPWVEKKFFFLIFMYTNIHKKDTYKTNFFSKTPTNN